MWGLGPNVSHTKCDLNAVARLLIEFLFTGTLNEKKYGYARIQFKMIATEGKTITTPLVHFGTCLLGLFSSSHSLTLSRSKQDRGVHSLCLSLSLLSG
jgi:hypothetical protein